MRRTRTDDGRVTIRAVAARAGVSAMTVSNVVNRTGKASAETRARVLRAVEELGYVPSQAARRLVGADTARIGMVYPVVDSVFVQAALAAASATVAREGLQLLMRAVDPDAGGADALARAVAALVRSGADALLVLPPFAERMAVAERAAGPGVPVAAVATGGPMAGVDTVRIDNRAAARRLTELLVRGGRRRIGVVAGPPSHSDSAERLAGHRDALAAHGLDDVADRTVAGDFTFVSGLAAAEALLDLRPAIDAVVAANDDMAAGVVWTAHRRGVALPDALAVVGFDDSPVATRVWPALTTVRQPIGAMIDAAIRLLVERLRGAGRNAAARDVVLDFEIVERGSTAE